MIHFILLTTKSKHNNKAFYHYSQCEEIIVRGLKKMSCHKKKTEHSEVRGTFYIILRTNWKEYTINLIDEDYHMIVKQRSCVY